MLVFVNTIAEIVHSRVHDWGGQCNKNLGNAFVIIWRIGDEITLMDQLQGGKKLRHTNSYADLQDQQSSLLVGDSSSLNGLVSSKINHHKSNVSNDELIANQRKKANGNNLLILCCNI